MNLQLIGFWSAVVLYAASTVFSFLGFVFSKNKYTRIGIAIAGIALLPHSLALYDRWTSAGHGPYMRYFEVLSADALVAVAIFIIFQFRYPKIRPVVMIIMPIIFIMLGIGLLQNQRVENTPNSFNTIWLVIHVLFAKLAYGSCLISASLGVIYLFKNYKGNTSFLSKLPDLKALDYLIYRMAGFGFIMLTIMIITGAIWANQAWGRYWGWDPVETWALISWLIYGIYLHRRFTFRIVGKKSAWFTILAFIMVVFAYFISPFLYTSVHEHLN